MPLFKRLGIEPYNAIALLLKQQLIVWTLDTIACPITYRYRWSGGEAESLSLCRIASAADRGPAARSGPPASTQGAVEKPP